MKFPYLVFLSSLKSMCQAKRIPMVIQEQFKTTHPDRSTLDAMDEYVWPHSSKCYSVVNIAFHVRPLAAY